MKLIIGLGNPEPRYDSTRHNLGALTVFHLARVCGLDLAHRSLHSLWARGRCREKDCILAFPQTYMNLSGQAVQALVHYFKIPLEKILIITDDLNLPFGKMRFRGDGSAGGHNGLKSIIECLGTVQFPRLRLGVGQTPPGWDTADYVLAKFTQEEQRAVRTQIEHAGEAVQTWIEQGLAAAMREYNK